MKRFLTLLGILLITIVVCLNFIIKHNVYKKNEPSLIVEYVEEINEKEFENYIRENPNVFVYFCINGISKCNDFEEKLIEILKDNNYSDNLVYLNLRNLDVKKIYDKYKNGKIEYSYPLIVCFSEHKISDYVSSINKVSDFFEKNID